MGRGLERNYELFTALARELRIPLIRPAKRVSKYYSAYKKYDYTGVHVLHDDFSSRMLVFEIDIPTDKKSVRYVLYISTQDWYITPSKVLPKIRKVRKYWLKYYFGAHVYKAIIAKRWTKGAQKLCEDSGIPLRKFKHVKHDIVKFFRNKYVGLLNSLRGKRLFGELVFKVWLLQEIAKELGITDVPIIFNDTYEVMKAVEQGIDIPQDLGPP